MIDETWEREVIIYDYDIFRLTAFLDRVSDC